MRRLILGSLLLMAGLARLLALDATGVTRWEAELAPAMMATEPTVLEGLQRDLAARLAGSPGDAGISTELGIVYHTMGRIQGGKKGYATQAAELLQKVADGPAPEELKVFALPYLGSALCLEARDSANPIATMDLLNKGLARLDAAVSRYGTASYIPRFLRANVTLALPVFFKQLDKGGSDLQALEAWTARDPGLMAPHLLSQIENLLGNYYKKKNQVDKAIAAWKRAVALDPEGKEGGREAAKSLATYAG